MSEEFPELPDLEARLRQAHAFAPRPGLRAEVRAALRPARRPPWPALAAAAAVLVAAVGTGLLLHSGPGRLGGGTAANLPGAASSTLKGAAPQDVASFGLLPAPALTASSQAGLHQTAAPASSPPPAGRAWVYRRTGGALSEALYGVRPAPAGSQLVYVAVQDGPSLYLEPVYLLAGGAAQSALTADELRP